MTTQSANAKTTFSPPEYVKKLVPLIESGKFKNPTFMKENAGMWTIMKSYFNDKSAESSPNFDFPIETLDRDSFDLEENETSIFRLGHSSVLIHIDGKYWLTDPVFSDRASPLSWIGPKRFHPVPVAIENLPDIEGVLISHDHYDHLDKETIKNIHTKVKHFYVPLKVGKALIDWGVPSQKVTEMTWWQELQVGKTTLAATPAHHFSGRGLMDANHTLWASWVLKGTNSSVFYSGDSGYFEGFKNIGDKYGPFDITLIETGAYNENWAGVHMMPEESMQAHIDLQGKLMVPVHNSTFDLALHAWYEPLQSINQLALKRGQQLYIPKIGERVASSAALTASQWWQSLIPSQLISIEDVDSNSRPLSAAVKVE